MMEDEMQEEQWVKAQWNGDDARFLSFGSRERQQKPNSVAA